MEFESISLAPLLAAILSGLLIFFTLRKGSNARLHRAFVILNASTFIWLFLYFIEINFSWDLYNPSSPYTSPLYVLIIIEYIGISTVPVHWLLFSLAFARRLKWLSGWRRLLIYSPTVLALLFMPTNGLHHMWYTVWAPDPYVQYGPLFYVYSSVAYFLIIYSMFIYIKFAWGLKEKIYKKQAIVMLIGSGIAFVGNVIWVSRDFTGLNVPVDPTPLLFFVANVVFFYALFRMGFLELIPFAVREVFYNMEDGVIVLDKEGRIIEANPSASKMFGKLSPSTSLSTTSPELFNEISSVFNMEKSEFEMKIGNRHIWVRALKLITEGEHAGTLAILTDITEIKRKEEIIRKKNAELEKAYVELEKAETELVQSGKMAALGQLVEGIESEIIEEIRKMEIALERSEEGSFNEIKESIARIKNIIKRLGIFSESKETRIELTDIRENIGDILEEMSGRLENVDVNTEFTDNTEIYCSPHLMKRVWKEILKNSIEAKATKIEIKATWDESSQMLRIDFIDNGIGMDENTLKRVYVPFFTTKGFAGLGLTYAFQTVRDHGGRMEMESKKGGGTRVSIFLSRFGRAVIEDIFLIHIETGLLIQHVGIKGEMDEDILSSMFTVVMSFIKDSFSGKDKEASLSMMELGDRRISIERGRYTFMVIIFRGPLGEALPRKIKRRHATIEQKYADSLEKWDGTKEVLPGIEKELSVLMEI
jgi:PAS domain S-box-containing protein